MGEESLNRFDEKKQKKRHSRQRNNNNRENGNSNTPRNEKKMKETENGEDNGLSVTARDRISAEIRDLYKGPSHEPISIHNPKTEQ